MRKIPVAFVLAGSCLVAGCSVTSAPALTVASNGTPRAFSQIELIEPDSAQAQRSGFYSAVAKDLQDKGIGLSEGADAVGDLSLSVTPSAIGVFVNDKSAPDASARPIATVRNSRWYDKCGTVRVSASLVVYDRSSGTELGNSKAEAITCEGGDVPNDELAALLVSDLLAN